MPTLKQLTCHVEWANSQVPFQEYGTSYEDGIVRCFVAVPTSATPFCISLKSHGYIAPGLAMFVFIDGVYQCNRNRNNLSPSEKYGENGKRRRDVTFRVRQKEEILPDGSWVGRPWRFEPLHLVPDPPKGPNIPADHFKHLGTIQVVILRCAFQRKKDSDGDELSDGVLTPQSYMAPGYSPDDVDPISDDESIHEVVPKRTNTEFFGLDERLGAIFDGPHDGQRPWNPQNDNRNRNQHCPECRNGQANQRHPRDGHNGFNDGYWHSPVVDNRRQPPNMPQLADDIHHCRHHNCVETAMVARRENGTSCLHHLCHDRCFESDSGYCSCQHSSSSTPCSYASCSVHRNGLPNGVRLLNGNTPTGSSPYGDPTRTSNGNGPSVVLTINAPYNPDPHSYVDPPFAKRGNRNNSDSGCYQIENGHKVHQKDGWAQNRKDQGWLQKDSGNGSNKGSGNDWESAAKEGNNSGTTWESKDAEPDWHNPSGGNDSSDNQGWTDTWGQDDNQDTNSDQDKTDNWGGNDNQQANSGQQPSAEDPFQKGGGQNGGGGSNESQNNTSSSWQPWGDSGNQTDANNCNTESSHWDGNGSNNTTWSNSNGDGQQANGHYSNGTLTLGSRHPFVSPGSRDQVIDEPPLYTVPEGLAKKRCLSHKVQPGARAKYCHNIRTPKYIDSIEKPYAKFIFEYRRREVIQDKLNVEVKRDLEAERKILESLPRAEIVNRLLEAQGLLGQQPQSGWQKTAQGNGASSPANDNSANTWGPSAETPAWDNTTETQSGGWNSWSGDRGGGNGGRTSPVQADSSGAAEDPFAKDLTAGLQVAKRAQDNKSSSWNEKETNGAGDVNW